jgi:hypothetical protein
MSAVRVMSPHLKLAKESIFSSQNEVYECKSWSTVDTYVKIRAAGQTDLITIMEYSDTSANEDNSFRNHIR